MCRGQHFTPHTPHMVNCTYLCFKNSKGSRRWVSVFLVKSLPPMSASSHPISLPRSNHCYQLFVYLSKGTEAIYMRMDSSRAHWQVTVRDNLSGDSLWIQRCLDRSSRSVSTLLLTTSNPQGVNGLRFWREGLLDTRRSCLALIRRASK